MPNDRPSVGSGPLLALDVGGTKTVVAAVDGAPRDGFHPIRPPVRFATPRDPRAFLDALAVAADAALPRGIAPVAIGIGAPGPLDPATGVIEYSTNLGWRDLPLARLVSERFGGIATTMNDDGNAGALGEAHAGAGRGADPFAFITLGTGLGIGIVVEGRVVAGAHGAAGELGHLAVGDRNGPMCACRRRNCVETRCGGAALARRARETWPDARLRSGEPSPRDAAAIFALARRGDPAAIGLVDRARHALAIAIAALLATIDPEAISVGGAIGSTQPAFVRAAFREGASLVHWSTGRRVELRAPELGEASVVAGAAILAAAAVDVTGTAGSDR